MLDKQEGSREGCINLPGKGKQLMFESPLYGKNMLDYHWLIKNLICSMTEKDIARWEN